MASTSGSAASEITRLLIAAEEGDQAALERLWNRVYGELRRLARVQLRREGDKGAMQTTSLVNEAYFKLIGTEPVTWENRRHFFGAAARAMRRIRIDRARARLRDKRGGGRQADPLSNVAAPETPEQVDMLAMDDALGRLEEISPRQAEVVMMRFFAGLSIDETARALGVSARSVDHDWRFARAWLHRELSGTK